MKSRIAIKLVAVACFFLIAIASLLAHQVPASGYELSIYAHTPVMVWVCLIASTLGGVTILVHQAVTGGFKNSNFWLVGMLIIIIAQISLLWIPYVRGYVQWRGDTTSHVGYIMDILITNHFDIQNFYPIVHVLLAENTILTGIPELTVVMLGPALATLAYLLSVYLLATAIIPEKGKVLLAIAATAGMPITLSIAPTQFSITLIPLLLLLYFKQASQPYRILLLILLTLFPFFHVLSSLMVIVILVFIELSVFAYGFIIKRSASLIVPPRSGQSLNLIMFESIVLITWLLKFQRFFPNLLLLVQQLASLTGPDVLGGMSETLDKINVHGTDFIMLLFKMYGVEIIFIVLSLVAGGLLLKHIYSGDVKSETHGLFALLAVFLFMGFLYLLYLIGAPGLQAIQPTRILYIVMVFTPVFVGFGLCTLFQNGHFRYLVSAGIICIITLASVLATFRLYDSPYQMRPNNQITMMDMSGMRWFVECKDATIGCVDIRNPVGRFAIALMGKSAVGQRADLDRGADYSEMIPDHFNYDLYSSLGQSYTANRYATITRLDRLLYTELWPEVGRFNYADFDKLELDTTVDKLYSNSELDVYFIHAVGK